jgi:hypothetical protein
MAVGAVENAVLCVFQGRLWARSSRPQLRQLPRPVALRAGAVIEVRFASSAASPGVPRGPRASAPGLDVRPGEVVRGRHPVGSCAGERPYRGDGRPRRVERAGRTRQ